jgi:hypothetical protein
VAQIPSRVDAMQRCGTCCALRSVYECPPDFPNIQSCDLPSAAFVADICPTTDRSASSGSDGNGSRVLLPSKAPSWLLLLWFWCHDVDDRLFHYWWAVMERGLAKLPRGTRMQPLEDIPFLIDGGLRSL